MKSAATFWPSGTVFGTLLNFRGELRSLGEQMLQAPYKAAPQAPVLYIKTANTWSAIVASSSGSPTVMRLVRSANLCAKSA